MKTAILKVGVCVCAIVTLLAYANGISGQNFSNENWLDISASSLELTTDEIQWLESSPKVSLGYINYPPYYINDKDLPGLAIEYVCNILDNIGITYELIEYKSLEEMRAAAISDECPTIIPATTALYGLSERYNFTKNWVDSEVALFTHINDDILFANDIEEIEGSKIATVNGGTGYNYLINFDSIETIKVDTPEEGLTMLQDGKADAFAVDKLTGLYYIAKYKLQNIASTDLEDAGENKFRTAVSKNEPVLYSIIDKAVKATPTKYLNNLRKKYYSLLQNNNVIRFERVAKKGFLPLLVFTAILLVMYICSLKSRKKLIVAKTQLENEEREKHISEPPIPFS